MLETIEIIFEISRGKVSFQYLSSVKSPFGQCNFYISAFPSYKNLIVTTYEIHTSFTLKWARFEPLIPRDICTINCYKFTPPNALGYQYQDGDVSLKGGFYPKHCTLLCTWMQFL